MQAITSFRELLTWLDARGELAHVKRAVDPTHELIAVMRKMQKGPNDALLFEHVKGSAARVASNVFGRRGTLAASLGLEAATLVADLVAREGRKLPLDEITAAPCQEVVHTRDIDIAKLIPQVVHSERDAGAYVTAGIFLARHPDTGVHNASFNRAQIVGGDKLRARMMPPQHLGQYQAAAERRNAGLPTAVIVGAPPSVMLSAASKIPFEADELEVAGAWQNQALRVVKARTQPLLVPADAEFVIEGEVLAHVREEEGPFGEFTDGYVEVGRNHVFRVTAVTHRRDPIWHVILAGGKEDLTLLGVPLATEVHKRVSGLAKRVDIGTPGQILGCVGGIEKTS
ncbi:MAG: UbiD family decarboxylase domain-containing protein, partial [Alphaproteobacteria bacterium]